MSKYLKLIQGEEFDRFGNLFVAVSAIGTTDLATYLKWRLDQLEHAEDLKTTSLVLYGCVGELENHKSLEKVGNLNRELIVGGIPVPVGSQVRIIRIPGKTTTPQVCFVNDQPTIQSGHLLAIFQQNGTDFFILVKDKTKPVLLLPGGTSILVKNHLSEVPEIPLQTEENLKSTKMVNVHYLMNFVDKNHSIEVLETPLQTCLREFQEETETEEHLMPEMTDIDHFCEMQMTRPLLGIQNIPDVSHFFHTKLLFYPFDESEFANGFYYRRLENNLEIEEIYGVPLKACTDPNFRDLNEKFEPIKFNGIPVSRNLLFVLSGFKMQMSMTISGSLFNSLNLPGKPHKIEFFMKDNQ